MPTYDYLCDACEHEFELFQSMKDDPISKCPECGKKKVRRLIGGGSGIIFKGSGFYETDYKRQGSSSGKSADEKSSGSDKSSESKPSETKTASKKESGKTATTAA